MSSTSQLERKSLSSPEETRPFKDGKGKLEIVVVGGHTMGRGTFEPRWRWSEHVKPIAGTPSCQAKNTGYVVEGRWWCEWMTGLKSSIAPATPSTCRPDMMRGLSVTDAACLSTLPAWAVTQSQLDLRYSAAFSVGTRRGCGAASRLQSSSLVWADLLRRSSLSLQL